MLNSIEAKPNPSQLVSPRVVQRSPTRFRINRPIAGRVGRSKSHERPKPKKLDMDHSDTCAQSQHSHEQVRLIRSATQPSSSRSKPRQATSNSAPNSPLNVTVDPKSSLVSLQLESFHLDSKLASTTIAKKKLSQDPMF